MILIVASLTDDEATSVGAKSPSEVVVLTPLDLCSDGWCVELGASDATFVADGQQRSVSELEGVVTRLVMVPSAEMLVLAESDREYAACESTALLAWWLSTLSCPVINEPDPSSLVGPRFHPLQWARLAAELNIPTHTSMSSWGPTPTVATLSASTQARVPSPSRDSLRWCVTIDGEPIDREPIDEVPETIADRARLLARHAPQRLCGFAFTPDSLLCGVTPLPALDAPVWDRLTEVFR